MVNAGDGVGATALLEPGVEVLQLDFGLPATAMASELGAILKDRGKLAGVGQLAALKSRSWSETANVQALVGMLAELL